MSTGTGDEQERGRAAHAPSEIPKAGWRDILLRLKDAIREDRITLIAAGVAFYAMLAGAPDVQAGLYASVEIHDWQFGGRHQG